MSAYLIPIAHFKEQPLQLSNLNLPLLVVIIAIVVLER